MSVEHLIVNLKTLGRDIRKLKRIIDIYEKSYKNSNVVVYDTDLKYIKKEISVFLTNLKKEINKNITKNSVDIFNREYLGISKYIYAELVFSNDFLNISSIRLLGRKDRKTNTVPRYVAFNLNNPYDPAIISIISNIKKIIKIDLKKLKKNPDFLKFFTKYVRPLPLIKNIKNTKKSSQEQLKNLSNKFDLKPFKSLEDFRVETKSIEDIELKTLIYDSRLNETISLNSLARLIVDAESIIEKIQNSLDHNPGESLSDIYSELLNKYNLGKILADLSMPLLKDIEPVEYIKQLPIEELLKLIDQLPEEIKEKIYSIINSKININSFLTNIDGKITNLIEPCNFISLKDTNPQLDINEILTSLRTKYPRFKFPEIETIINEEFTRLINIDDLIKLIEPNLNLDLKQFALKIPDIQFPQVQIPSLNITDLFGEISSGLDELILSGISVGVGKISINLLESVLKSQADESLVNSILNSVPENVVPPNVQFPNIGNINYPNLNINFDIKKLFKKLETGELTKFESIFGDKWQEFSTLLKEIINESQKFNASMSSAPELNIKNLIDSVGGIQQLKKQQELENKKCKDFKISPPDFEEQNLDLDLLSSSLTNLAPEDTTQQLYNQIRNYRYSNIHSFLINKKPNKKIITLLKSLAESDIGQRLNKPAVASDVNITKSVAKMMESVSSLLVPAELLNLFAGDYTQETANIVRNIAKLNYPELASIIDPVKFYIILGKLTGLSNFKIEIDKFRELGGKK